MTVPAIRSALFLPASNPRAVAKARTCAADLVILDLEDAVADGDKDAARDAAAAALGESWTQHVAVRVNAIGTPGHERDLAALAGAALDYVVVPKADDMWALASLTGRLSCSALAMIETPAGVRRAFDIANVPEMCGLIVGANDLAAALRLPANATREGMAMALQSIVLAARDAGRFVLDGVYNHLDDAEGLEADCRAARAMGFDGKTLIHPSQIEAANRLFGPSEADLEEARALIAAATGGAQRFRGRMIETMHVDAARRLLGDAG